MSVDGQGGEGEDVLDSLDVFEDRGEGPVEGDFLAVGEAKDAAFGSGGVG